MHAFTRTFVLMLCAALAPHAGAQSFNIDFGTGLGLPSDSFGAAAAQPGDWNGIPFADGVPFPLSGLNGSPTAASVAISGASGEQLLNSSPAAGDLRALVADRLLSTFAPIHADLTGLQPGLYDIYTYAVGGGPHQIRITMNGDDATGQIITMGIQDELVLGRTHVIHRVLVADGTLRITSTIGDPVITGAQLVLVPSPAAAAVLGLPLLIRPRRRRAWRASGDPF